MGQIIDFIHYLPGNIFAFKSILQFIHLEGLKCLSNLGGGRGGRARSSSCPYLIPVGSCPKTLAAPPSHRAVSLGLCFCS